MSHLASAFQAECIKWRKGWALLTVMLAPVCQTGFLFAIFWFSEERVKQFLPGFRFWIEINFVTWNLLFLPITAALVSDLSWGLEDESKAWNHLFAQPLPRQTHFLVKLVSHVCLLMISQLLLTLLLIPEGLLLQNNPHLSMGPAQGNLLLRFAGFSLLASLAIVAFHTWVSARIRGLWFGIAIGIGGTWCCVQLIDYPQVVQFLPWGMASQMAGVIDRLRPLPGWSLALGSLGSAILLGGLGTLDFTWCKLRS